MVQFEWNKMGEEFGNMVWIQFLLETTGKRIIIQRNNLGNVREESQIAL